MVVVLYCKNVAVYDIDSNIVIDKDLLPGLMRLDTHPATFKKWLKIRYSSNTNSLARQLKGIVFGQGNRVTINKKTHALSLSDCYWVKDQSDTTTFEQISPYYAPFWDGSGVYSGQSIPTLYVGGCLNKRWVSCETLEKFGNNLKIEEDVSRLCAECGVPANKVISISGGVAIRNITNTSVMLEQADQSGMLDPDDFTEDDIIRLFQLRGVQMLTIDAIIANGDRHAGNFGWLRDTNTGRYLCMAPLYDFDHALDSRLVKDRLLVDAVSSIKATNNGQYVNEMRRICATVCRLDTVSLFKERAKAMLTL